jgi:hypothetical protein
VRQQYSDNFDRLPSSAAFYIDYGRQLGTFLMQLGDGNFIVGLLLCIQLGMMLHNLQQLLLPALHMLCRLL